MFCSQLFGEALSFGLTSSLYLHEAFKKEDIYLQVMYHVQHDSLMHILNLNRNAFFCNVLLFLTAWSSKRGPASKDPHFSKLKFKACAYNIYTLNTRLKYIFVQYNLKQTNQDKNHDYSMENPRTLISSTCMEVLDNHKPL